MINAENEYRNKKSKHDITEKRNENAFGVDETFGDIRESKIDVGPKRNF